MKKVLDSFISGLSDISYPVDVGTLIEGLVTNGNTITIKYVDMPSGIGGSIKRVGSDTFILIAISEEEKQRLALSYCLGLYLLNRDAGSSDYVFTFGLDVQHTYLKLVDLGVIDFSSELLNPRKVITKIFADTPDITLGELSSFFGIPLSTMDYRLTRLGYV